MKYVPTYQDYLSFASNQYDPDGKFTGLTEAQWNALDENSKWGQVGGSIAINSTDPRYADLKPQVGGEDGRNIYLRQGAMGADDVYSQTDVGDGIYAHSEDQQTPHFQASSEASMAPLYATAGLFFGAGLLNELGALGGLDGAAGAAGGEGATGAATAAGSGVIDESTGLIMDNAFPAVDESWLSQLSNGMNLDDVIPPPEITNPPLLDINEMVNIPELTSNIASNIPLDVPWYDRILNNLSRMPGLPNALSALSRPPTSGGSAPRAPGAGGGTAGGSHMAGSRYAAEQNPYVKGKINTPGSITEYLRGR